MALTNKVRGRAGRLFVSGTSGTTGANLGSIRNWALNLTVGSIDASDADSNGWTETFSGQRTWTMTAGAVYLSTGATSQQDDLRTAALAGSTKYFVLHTSTVSTTGANGGVEYGGWGWVSNFNPSGEYEGVALVNFEITGAGALKESS